MAGGLLIFVAAFVIVSSGLSLLGYREPHPSFAGIILLIVAAIGMPWLASQKRKLAQLDQLPAIFGALPRK